MKKIIQLALVASLFVGHAAAEEKKTVVVEAKLIDAIATVKQVAGKEVAPEFNELYELIANQSKEIPSGMIYSGIFEGIHVLEKNRSLLTSEVYDHTMNVLRDCLYNKATRSRLTASCNVSCQPCNPCTPDCIVAGRFTVDPTGRVINQAGNFVVNLIGSSGTVPATYSYRITFVQPFCNTIGAIVNSSDPDAQVIISGRLTGNGFTVANVPASSTVFFIAGPVC